MFCSETGFYQHPTDCSAFIACAIDDHVGKPVMNHMRCPKGKELPLEASAHISKYLVTVLRLQYRKLSTSKLTIMTTVVTHRKGR